MLKSVNLNVTNIYNSDIFTFCAKIEPKKLTVYEPLSANNFK
jgi:hypothetical protein